MYRNILLKRERKTHRPFDGGNGFQACFQKRGQLVCQIELQKFRYIGTVQKLSPGSCIIRRNRFKKIRLGWLISPKPLVRQGLHAL